MTWLIFDTKTEAEATEQQKSQELGFPIVDGVTSRWAIPRQLRDGRWAIPCPDDCGVELGPGDWPEPEMP